MNKLFYWQSWPTPQRIFMHIAVVVFFVAIIASLILHLLNFDLISWHVLSQKINFPVIQKVIDIGSFQFQVLAEKSVIQDIYQGGAFPSTAWLSIVLLINFAVGLACYCALVTFLNRFWYIISMAMVLLIFVFFHAEMMEVLGLGSKWTLVLIYSLLLIPGYYLHAYRTHVSFLGRLGVMSISVAILVGLFLLFPHSEFPISYLAGYGQLAFLMLAVFFILMVAHEIMAAFIRIVTDSYGIGNKSRLRHFMILSLIYIANLLLSYLHSTHVIDWNIIYLDPYFLLAISSVLGLWGIKSRLILFSAATKYDHVWIMLYLIIGIVSYAFMSQVLLSLNDPYIQIIGDLVIYAHLCMAVAFFLYVLYNFIPLIEKGLPVYKVLYQPKNLPYLTYRLVGVLAIFALMAVRGFDYPAWYSMGGYYNAIADQALENQNIELAKIFYRRGSEFAFHNNKSNYSLGRLSSSREAEKDYEFAVERIPSAQAYVNLAFEQQQDQAYYESLFSLQEGIKKVPDPRLYNNLGLQYLQLNLIDSALQSFQLTGFTKPESKSNYLAVLARADKPLDQPLPFQLTGTLTPSLLTNAAAFDIFPDPIYQFSKDNMYQMAYLNNLLLGDPGLLTDSTLSQAKGVIDHISSAEDRENMQFSLALASFNYGQVNQCFQYLQALSMTSKTHSEKMYEVIGLLYLQLGELDLAIDNLEVAVDRGRSSANLPLAVAYSENGNSEKALEQWRNIISNRTDLAFTSRFIIKLLSEEKVVPQDDYTRIIAVRFSKYSFDELTLAKVIRKIEDQRQRASTAIDMAQFYLKSDNTDAATDMLKLIGTDQLSSELNSCYNWTLLRVLARTGIKKQELQELAKKVDEDRLLSGERDYLHWIEGEIPDSIQIHRMAYDNAFFPEGTLLAARLLKKNNSFVTYNILADAIQVNPGSAALLKAYIKEALRLGFDQYAADAMIMYRQRFPGQGYMQFQSEVDSLRKTLVEQ